MVDIDGDGTEPRTITGKTSGNNNLNNMVAKVTIDTPSGSSSKYYLLYRDPCYSLGSLAVGALGTLRRLS
jgi:hypothetical protein